MELFACSIGSQLLKICFKDAWFVANRNKAKKACEEIVKVKVKDPVDFRIYTCDNFENPTKVLLYHVADSKLTQYEMMIEDFDMVFGGRNNKLYSTKKIGL